MECVRLQVGTRSTLALLDFPLQSADGYRLVACGVGVCSVFAAVHQAGHWPGLKYLSLLFYSQFCQLRHDLHLPLPPLSIQEMERQWRGNNRGLIAFGVPVSDVALILLLRGATATDHVVQRQVCVHGCRRCSELFLALSELLKLTSKQGVLQVDLRAGSHLVTLPLLLPQHHLEWFGDGDIGVGPSPYPSMTSSLGFRTGGLLEPKLLVVHSVFWAQQAVSGGK